MLPVLALLLSAPPASVGASAAAEPVDLTMIPKFEGLVVFKQAHSGALAAHLEVGNPGNLDYLAPPSGSADGGLAQIDLVTAAAANGDGARAVLLSNNAGDDVAPACLAASDAGAAVVTWDSPVPSGRSGGEALFVSPVDFDGTGEVLADMAMDILGPGGGTFAILSSSAGAANQNAWVAAMVGAVSSDDRYSGLSLVEISYGDDDDGLSYGEAARLVGSHPDLDLIVSPTTIGIAAAARAVRDLGACGSVRVTGLGVPAEMLDHTLSGCAPRFALWSFVDLGYLTYRTAYAIASGDLEAEEGGTFRAGRLGSFAVERDPTREDALRVVMGGFTVYDRSNVEAAAFYDAIKGDGGRDDFEERYMSKYRKRALAIIPKVTGMISFLSSAYIVQNVLRSAELRGQTLNRLLVGISINDMVSSFFGFFLSTWPMPADTWLVHGNVGTTQTCTMQGFFFQGGIASAPLYTAALSTFYVMTIGSQSPPEKALRVEPYLHLIPSLFGWGTAIAGLPLKLYNAGGRVGFMCWIAEYPPYCSLRDNCQRGNNAFIYRWAFLYAEVLAVLFYMIVCMFMIYRKVLSVEKATDRWRDASGQARLRSHSKKVAKQGFSYVVAFFVPWMFGITIQIIKHQSYGDIKIGKVRDSALTSLEICNAIIFPLKGFFNLVVYVRPKKRVKKKLTGMITKCFRAAQNMHPKSTQPGSRQEPSGNNAAGRETLSSDNQ